MTFTISPIILGIVLFIGEMHGELIEVHGKLENATFLAILNNTIAIKKVTSNSTIYNLTCSQIYTKNPAPVLYYNRTHYCTNAPVCDDLNKKYFTRLVYFHVRCKVVWELYTDRRPKKAGVDFTKKKVLTPLKLLQQQRADDKLEYNLRNRRKKVALVTTFVGCLLVIVFAGIIYRWKLSSGKQCMSKELVELPPYQFRNMYA